MSWHAKIWPALQLHSLPYGDWWRGDLLPGYLRGIICDAAVAVREDGGTLTAGHCGRRCEPGSALCRGHLEIEQGAQQSHKATSRGALSSRSDPLRSKLIPGRRPTGDRALSPGIADRKAIGVAA
jgi:hypothetical protein